MPKNRLVGNRKAVTKDTIWQHWLGKNAPLAGALLFAALLAALTVWFTYGALGPWVVFWCLFLALLSMGFVPPKTTRFLAPLLLGLSALALASFAGGLNGPASSAILWPILGMAALGKDQGAKPARWIGGGVAASLCVLIGLVLIGGVTALRAEDYISAPSAICALGVCGALAIAAIVGSSRVLAPNAQAPNIEVLNANKSRDAALRDAEDARLQNRERAQFMAEMSHEIRTPLNAILGFADTMRAQVFGPLPAPYGDYPDLIHTSGSHLLDVVSDLLDLSKIEAGRYEMKLTPVSLDELASEGVSLAAGSARSAGVSVRKDIPAPVMVMGDARAMRQIIFNLVSNAIKFTPTGGQVVVRVRTDETMGTATIDVQDNGVGMSEADLNRIGQPWNQADTGADAAKGKRGSGLGLALVKRLCELMDARFELGSLLGVGTRAVVTLPLLVDATPPV